MPGITAHVAWTVWVPELIVRQVLKLRKARIDDVSQFDGLLLDFRGQEEQRRGYELR